MVDKIHLWPEELTEADGSAIAAVTIEGPTRDRTRLWYSVETEYRPALTRSSDPFVAALLFRAMRESADMIVHGEVSPSLLRNLEEFQAAWAAWLPNRYTRIEIVAEVEREQPTGDKARAGIVAFSGGVDSSFTVFRHKTGRCGRLKRNIPAGVMAQWSSSAHEVDGAIERVAEKSAKMLASLDMNLIRMRTNVRELGDSWHDAHGAAIASCLMVLQGGYTEGLIASSRPYRHLTLPYGSSPVTDWLMSSDAFQIVHDGAAFTRSDKIRELAHWPEALRYLQVCWEGGQPDRNCGRCEKCIRNILAFRAAGLGLPECFEQDVSDSQILNLSGLGEAQIGENEDVLAAARAASISDSWVDALEECIRRNWAQQNEKNPPENPVRQAIKRIPGARKLWQLVRRTTP
jgi:hypothetical protein